MIMRENFNDFITRFSEGLSNLFHDDNNIDALSLERGLPDAVWDDIMGMQPLSVAIPEEFGGRGLHVSECLGILAAASYESLPLSLTFGINIALFMEPLAKYGHEEIQKGIFDRFLNDKAMGGLMITEPDYGSDALNMQTQYTETENGYRIKGKKHWQGLTGMADYWIVAARKANPSGDLARDIDFFVTAENMPGQQIQVEKYFNNLGLYMIPYGLNTLDLEVPDNQRLQAPRTGIKMMLDILHRSRLQFPGMAMGFIRRMLDEALQHTDQRMVAGKKLAEMDSVRYQLSRIQAAYSLCSGMCARSSGMSGIDQELATRGMEANVMKALVTDLMQESAQICVQLNGSAGYKLDHVAGRGIVDSRPFQIFEGSNEMLYTQIAEGMIKAMKKSKDLHLKRYLAGEPLTSRVADQFGDLFDFQIGENLPQRQLVSLGRVMARVASLQYVEVMTEAGFRSDLYENTRKHMEADVRQLLTRLRSLNDAEPVEGYRESSDWMQFIIH